MRTTARFFAIALALSLISVLSAHGQKEPPALGPFVFGELLVRFRAESSKSAITQVHAALGANVVRTFELVPNLQLVRLPSGILMTEALTLYKKNPNVLYAEPNSIRRASQQILLTPNDPQFAQLWALNNTGQTGGTPDADIDAPEAWNISTGSSSVVVAVIDTGVDYTHPDLSANMWRNPLDCNTNNIDDDGNGYRDDCYGIDTANNDSNPMDDNGHGTHVAGTIGARGNNSVGVVGVNWNVQIMACKFLDEGGSGSDADAITCLEYVKTMKERGVNIVATNNSWGGGDFSQALYDAIRAQMDAGILFIAAAGNESADTTPSYPANYFLPNIISVAATTHTDALASFSNFGQRTVHVGAPGGSILSTTPNNSYSTFSGTSMATPHVTGLAALIKAQNSSLDWIALRNVILSSGDAKASLQNKTITGRRINAYGALTCTNAPVFAVLRPLQSVLGGEPIAVLNINCASPAGPLSVTLNPGGPTIALEDNGLGPDLAANDGIYSGTLTLSDPCAIGTYTLDFSNGESLTVQIGGASGSYSCTASSLSWRTFTGTNLNLGDDDAATITSPFPVRLGAASYSSIRVGANGAVSFHQADIPYNNGTLPSSSFTTLIAPFWDDLYAVPGTSNNVFWGVLGTAPDRELVIEWRNVRPYNCRNDSSAGVRFQIVFFESTREILFNYLDTVFGGSCTGQDRGGSASVGVQVSPSDATQIGVNSPVLSDNLALVWDLAGTADLALTKSDGPDPVTVGSTLTYTLTVTNTGPASATGVTLSDPLPGGVTFVSATASQGTCAQASNTVTCSLATLPNGASATVTIAVMPTAASTLTNTASVTAETSDPDPGNNSASTSTTVTANGCAGVTATSSPSSVQYTPTATRPSRKTIRVVLRNTTTTPQTITALAPQLGEPFTIVGTRPSLPRTIAAKKSLTLYVLTERAAGLGSATATRPYFVITLSCGTLTSASEPRLLSLEQRSEQVRLEARGGDVTALRVQIYDLSGRVLIDQTSRAAVLAVPLTGRDGKRLANGVYLYAVTVVFADGRSVKTEVRKLLVMR